MSSIYEIKKKKKKNMFDNQKILKNYLDTLIKRIENEEDRETGSNYDELQGAKDVLISVRNFIRSLEEIKE